MSKSFRRRYDRSVAPMKRKVSTENCPFLIGSKARLLSALDDDMEMVYSLFLAWRILFPFMKLWQRMTQVMLMALMPSKQSNLLAVFRLLSKMDSILLTRENEINIFLLGVINFDINRLMNIHNICEGDN